MKVLDLFCGAGGAAMGLHQAWPDADITGVDVRPQKHYPFRFIQADAMTFPLDGYDFIWASPPCQEYSALRARTGKHYPDLVVPTRHRLRFEIEGAVWVMENVPGAPLFYSMFLCGAMFGLRAYRHRQFESNQLLMQPPHPRHLVPVNRRKTNRRAHWDAGGFVTVVGDIGRYVGPQAMGIDWMTGHELSQAVPPAYSRYIALQLSQALEAAA